MTAWLGRFFAIVAAAAPAAANEPELLGPAGGPDVIVDAPVDIRDSPRGTLLPLREEPYAAIWEVIHGKQACQGNSENITAHGTKAGVETALACMQACEGRWGCLAVDYYATTKFCNFYRTVCKEPQATHDGASSYRIRLPVAWTSRNATPANCRSKPVWQGTLKRQVALELAGIKGSGEPDGAHECKDLCERESSCLSVDYFSKAKLCRLQDQVCDKADSAKEDAANQIATSLAVGETTVQEVGQSFAMRRSLTWVQIDAKKGCQENAENIAVAKKRYDPAAGFEGCKSWCERHLSCRALDYTSSGWCLLFDGACINPNYKAYDTASWRVLREGMEEVQTQESTTGFLDKKSSQGVERANVWSQIDANKACQGSGPEVHFREIQGGERFGLKECQMSCENHGRCSAIDWYRHTRYCLMYEDACLSGSASHDGASSYKIVRSDLARRVLSDTSDDDQAQQDSWRSQVLMTLKDLDPHRTGFVSVADLQRAMRTHNRAVTDEDMLGILSEVAVNADGLVNYKDALGLAQSLVWARVVV